MTTLLRRIRHGYNNSLWSAELQCVGDSERRGCGAIFEVPRGALFTATVQNMGETRDEVHFCCSDCDVETPVSDGALFKDLPTREQWLSKHRPKYGFVIQVSSTLYFQSISDGRSWSARCNATEATVFRTREAAQEVIEHFKIPANDQARIVPGPYIQKPRPLNPSA